MAVRRLLAYAAIYFLWGGSFLAIRQIVAVTPPFFAAGFRFLLAGLLLYTFSRAQGGKRPNKRECVSTAILGLIMFAGNYACLFWSEKFLPSGLAAVLSSSIPVWIFLLEWLVFRSSRITVPAICGILLGIAGVFLIALPRGIDASGATKPALVLLCGALLWSVGTVGSRRLALPKQHTISAGLQMAWGGGFLILLAAAAGEFSRLAESSRQWHWGTVFSMTYLIVAASIIAFTAYVWLIQHEPATRVASYAYVNPLVALSIGFFFAHERATALQSAGAVLVLAGVFSTLAGKRLAQRTPMETTA